MGVTPTHVGSITPTHVGNIIPSGEATGKDMLAPDLLPHPPQTSRSR